MKHSENPTSRTHKHFDPNFKEEAVRLWKSSGKSAALIGQELGIKPDRLYVWSRDLAPPPPGGKGGGGARSREQLQEENAALRQELELLRQQRDILKKTLGILSEPPKNAMNGSKR